MSVSSLIPERQLVFSPALAQTLGLEEAILLQHLSELFQHRSAQHRQGYDWLRVEAQWLLNSLPFWSTIDLHRISKSLADKGVILMDSPPLHDTETLVFTINESRTLRAPRAQTHTHPTRNSGASLIGAHWSPTEDLLQLLALNHGISRQFAIDQLEDFVRYRHECGEIHHAWENKYRQHVLSRWRDFEQSQAERFTQTKVSITGNWHPSADALEILEKAEINRTFIDDTVPEFILFLREYNPKEKAPNSKFIQHVRRQWVRLQSALVHDTEPARIPVNWQPTSDVFDILKMSHIDAQFAWDLLPEFVVYWKDTNQLYKSWNSKFLQHVKYHWAKRNEITTHAGQQGTHRTGRSRDRSLADDLNDRSWAQ